MEDGSQTDEHGGRESDGRTWRKRVKRTNGYGNRESDGLTRGYDLRWTDTGIGNQVGRQTGR